MGHLTDKLRNMRDEMKAPVHFHQTIHPDAMPAIYKEHQWMVYTGDFHLKTVGWPMAVAEAQAAMCACPICDLI